MNLPWQFWIVAAVVLVPILVVFGSIALKLLWGFWPVPASLALGGWGVWRMGIDWFWLVAIAILASIVVTWLWQRTRLFLAGDRRLEKLMLLGD